MPIWKRGVCLLAAVLLWAGLTGRLERVEPAFSPGRGLGTVLVIDAGHGGEDGGAVSSGGLVESHINLAVALRMAAVLDLYGVDYLLLRESDRSLHDEGCATLREKKISDLRNRVSAIESLSNPVLISVHQNTFPDTAAHGAQVFYAAHEESLPLARVVQDTLRGALDADNHRVPTGIPSSVYLMNHVTCPAVLVECGFLSNPAEAALLASGDYQTKLALALTASYLTYQQITKEGLTS